MANLPPRPGSPPKLRDDRDRHIIDDRDRDRPGPSAQPMASRPFRSDRIPERERTYVPRSRPGDTYFPRDGDRRDRDRDWDRSRDYDRGGRGWARDRERERSPRRWDPTDRDRRPQDRGPPRRPLSPRRGSRRDSRSPPPRRRYSRSRSPHLRGRYRTPNRGSPSPKRIRLGNHSIAASPRSGSPYKRRHSRERSHSPTKRVPEPTATSSKSAFAQAESPKPAPPVKDELMDTCLSEAPHVQKEEPPAITSPDIPVKPSEHTADQDTKTPVPATIGAQPKLVVKHESAPNPEPKEAKSEPEGSASQSVVEQKMAEETTDSPMHESGSPREDPTGSKDTKCSPSPRSSRATNDFTRAVPTGPQRGWAPRSPPRGPRNHARPMVASHQAPHQAPTSSYQAPRGPRRGFQPSVPSSFGGTVGTRQTGLEEHKSGAYLPVIPKYNPPQALLHIEQEILKLQSHRNHLATEHLQQVKGLRRALQELEFATIDLHAAESRRRVADHQLELAKTGSLGIDATEATLAAS